MWCKDDLIPIADDAPVTGPDGTNYPGNWDKSTLPFLHSVTLEAYPATPNVVVTGFHIDAGFTQVWETRSLTPSERISALAAKRYQVETGGTTWSGFPVATDRESQSKIAAAYSLARDGLWQGGWKFADGVYRPLDGTQVQTVAIAVAAHVQTCFAVEAVKAADDTDINTGWPS
jgi:hypothetical protein